MDSNRSCGSFASLAVKIRRCRCGRRMSSLTRDFHTVCVDCRDFDFDVNNRFIECTDVDDSVMTDYIKR